MNEMKYKTINPVLWFLIGVIVSASWANHKQRLEVESRTQQLLEQNERSADEVLQKVQEISELVKKLTK